MDRDRHLGAPLDGTPMMGRGQNCVLQALEKI